MTDIPVWMKLWHKGVDIASAVIASTLSALIVGAFAWVMWNWKKRRELLFEEEKLRLQRRMHTENETYEKLDRYMTLWSDPQSHVSAISNADNPRRLETAANGFLQWLSFNSLSTSGDNVHVVDEFRKYDPLGKIADANVVPIRTHLSMTAMTTKLAASPK